MKAKSQAPERAQQRQSEQATATPVKTGILRPSFDRDPENQDVDAEENGEALEMTPDELDMLERRSRHGHEAMERELIRTNRRRSPA